MKKKPSFSTGIIKTIKFYLAIAFIIMFIGGAILLFVTENDNNVFIVEILSTLVAYIALYFALNLTITRNVKKQFAPLDRLANGLRENSIEVIGESDDIKAFAKQLKADMEKLDNLSNELAVTRNNLDDVYISSEKAINNVLEEIDECKRFLVKSSKKQKRIKENLVAISNSYEDLIPISDELKQVQRVLLEESNTALQNMNSNIKNHNELKEDNQRLKESYDLLIKALNDAVGLIDSLFSELSVMQNIASQMNLYSMNASIEVSRSGIFNMNITNALDEIKGLSNKIQTKTDDIAMLSIQSKNSLNLANEHAHFLFEQNDDTNKNIDINCNNLIELSQLIKNLIDNVIVIADDGNKLIRNLEMLEEMNSNSINDINQILDITGSIGNKLFEIGKSNGN